MGRDIQKEKSGITYLDLMLANLQKILGLYDAVNRNLSKKVIERI